MFDHVENKIIFVLRSIEKGQINVNLFDLEFWGGGELSHAL